MKFSVSSEVAPVPRKTWRWPKARALALHGVAVVGVAFVILWLMTGLTASRTLRKAQVDADRLDPNWQFEELLARRPVVPDELNSARQVALSFSLLKGGFPRPAKIRPRGPFAPQGAPRFTRDPVTTRLDQVPAEERLDVALSVDVRRELHRVWPAVLEARKLANMARGRSDPTYANPLWATLLGHVQNSRDVARLLAADAAIYAQDGEMDLALDDARAILSVAQAIGDEPFIISQLVRIAETTVALSTAERVLNQGECTDQALERLQKRLAEEAPQPLAVWGLRGDRAASDRVMSQLATGEFRYRTVVGVSGADPTSVGEILTTVSSAFVRYNQGLVLSRMNEAIEIAKRPLSEQPELWERFQQGSTDAESKLSQLASSLSRETMPAVSSAGVAYLRSRAQLYAMMVVLAAERHRILHGAFPSRIEEIDPRFLPERLIDPFSGGSFHLKSDGQGGIIVYSVGHDRVDDGGAKLRLGSWMAKGVDLGYRLSSLEKRGGPPKLGKLPEDVFQQQAEDSDDELDSQPQ